MIPREEQRKKENKGEKKEKERDEGGGIAILEPGSGRAPGAGMTGDRDK